MSDDRLQLHEEISLSIKRKGERVFLKTRVTGTGDDSFSISLLDMPAASLQLVSSGDEVHGSVPRRDALYHFKSKIIEVIQDVPQPQVVFLQPESIWREQRRQFFRVDQNLPVSVRLEYQDSSGHMRYPVLEGTTVNISAGGIQILVSVPDAVTLEQGAHVLVTFTMQTQHFRDLPGTIIRVKESQDRQMFGMIFIAPDLDTQNKITRLNILYERRHLKGE
jgi:c-di-GMP-binding flagellar brake protein YcgR